MVNKLIQIDVTQGITVGGFNFEVEIDPKNDRELDAEGKAGDCSQYLQRIHIHSGLTPSDISNTFIHEALHSVDKVYLDSVLTEKQISVLANGLHQIMENLGIRFGKVTELKGE